MRLTRLSLLAAVFLCPLLSFSQSGGLFIENKGQVVDFEEQFHPEVKYYHSHRDASVYFQPNKLVYHFKDVEPLDLARYEGNQAGLEDARRTQKATYHRMDMIFVNASVNPEIVSGKQAQGVTHYYVSKRNGIRDVRSFETIRYQNIYPNIDAVFYSTSNGLKYDLILKSGANIQDIKLKFEGAVAKLENKKLILKTSLKDIVEEIPLSFINEDSKNEVEVNYILNSDGTIGFQLKSNIAYSTLTIDPVLEWSTYFNMSSGTDQLYNIANHLDNDGHYYSYGMAQNAASNYPVVNPGGAYTTAANGSADAYFVKFNADRQLVWSTYLGGSGYDEIYDGDIITTRGTTLHLVGERITTGAPFTNGGGFYQNVVARNFWARFNKNTGALEHLTSLSSGYKPSIAISNSGLVVISNDAYDFNNLPIVNRAGAYNQAVNGGTKDMGLLLFNASYTQIWGTFMGGTGSQENFSCVFDNNDNLYFVGETGNNAGLVNLPGAYNQTTVGGGTDVMLGKFTNTGQLVWSTLYGGNSSDARRGQQGHGARILIHPTTGELIMAFNTTSNNLPITNLAGAYNKGVPTHVDFGGSSGSYWNYAAYLCKFSTAGALNYSTYYYSGTGGGDLIENIAFGGCNKFYVGSAGEAAKLLTGAASGYNLTQATMGGRSGYITMMNASTFAFEWDGFLNSAISSEANVAANVNHAPFYSTATLYYQNLPIVNPGNGAYYNATSSNPSGGGVGISQFHPSLPPDVTDESICSGASITLTASGGMGAPYNWYSSLSSPTVLHTGATYPVSPTTTTVYYVSSGSGICASPRTPVTVTVTSITPGTASINQTTACSGSNAELTLTGHSGTIQWQYSTNGGANWNDISGATSTPYTVTNITTSTSYQAIVTSGSCSDNSSVVAITITSSVTPSVSISGTPASSICSGTSVTFTANPTNGGTTPTYQWQVNGGDVFGETNATFTTTTLNNNDVVTVIMTSNNPCASPTTASASTAAIAVTSTATPSVSISGTPVSAICSGTSVTFTANPTNGGTTPTYQWQVNGGDVSGETNATFTTTILNNNDVVTVIMTSNAPCASPTTASASTAAIAVTSTVTPSVSISGTPVSAICSGTSVTFTANPTNGGATPTYQWQVNGGDVFGETNSTFTTTTLNNNDVVTVIMTSNAGCASPTTASANTGSIGVANNLTPSVTISGAPASSICSGTSVTFTANPTNGGTSPTYQWQINGGDVSGETNATFTTTTLNNNDVVTVIMTSNDPCASPTTASANTGSISVTNNLTPSVAITGTPATTICPGTSVTFTANPTNGGTAPTYQWQINGGDVSGETNATFTTTVLNDNDVVTVIMTSNDPCASTATVSASTGVGEISVGDDEDPVLVNCPANMTISSGASCSSVATWTAPTATDNCSTPVITSTHQSGDTFTVGTTTVTYTATDATGNTATCSFTVQVIDNVSPQFIDCQSDTTLIITATNCQTTLPNYVPNVVATDNCTGNITYTQTPAPGSLVTTTSGVLTVQITATDAAGNQDVCLFEVTVIDQVPNANAGNDNTATMCSTGTFDLSVLLSNDAQPNGQWGLSSGSSTVQLNGSSLNLNGLDGTYVFRYTVGACKADTSYFTITIYDVDNTSAGTALMGNKYCPKDMSTINLNNLLINATTGGVWTPSGNAPAPQTDGTLNLTSLANGFYTYVYLIENGPCGSDTSEVIIEINCNEFDIPNYVTPNGDGIDDVFVVTGIENYPDNELTIVNRWGALVYQTTNYQNDWNGTSQSKLNVGGDELPTGTYYYILDTKSSVHGVKTGFIYLER